MGLVGDRPTDDSSDTASTYPGIDRAADEGVKRYVEKQGEEEGSNAKNGSESKPRPNRVSIPFRRSRATELSLRVHLTRRRRSP